MTLSLLLLGLTAAADPAAATDLAPVEVEAVEVTPGQRGKADGTVQPELVLDPVQIGAYGAGSIAELFAALEPQLRSGRARDTGPPVTLINGRRTSGFQEVRDIPPEAIERLEVLPEEVALTYGYRADQRVVNIVLRRRFDALTSEAGLKVPTAGGRTSADGQSTSFHVQGDQRWLVNAKASHDTALFETERSVVRTPGGSPYDLTGNVTGLDGAPIDPALTALVGAPVTVAPVPASAAGGAPALADFAAGAGVPATGGLTAWRTLLPRSTSASLNAALTRPVGRSSMATFSGAFEEGRTLTYLGLPSVRVLVQDGNPFSPFSQDVQLYRYIDDAVSMQRQVDTRKVSLGAALNGRLPAGWRWNTTSGYTRSVNRTVTGRGLNTAAFAAQVAAGDPLVNPFGQIPVGLIARNTPDSALSTTDTLKAEIVAAGELLQVPAGELSATFKAGADNQVLNASTVRNGVGGDREVSRASGNLQASLNLPITDRAHDVLAAVGDLSANVNVEYEQLSDYGGLATLGFGANWSPRDPVSFVASYTQEHGAPTPSQLNDPILSTPNVSIYDFSIGRTVLATRVEGGNPDLLADTRQVLKLGLNVKPLKRKARSQLTLSVNYTATRVEDSVSGFPAITADVEAAFPDRIIRDADGRLIAVDSRPVNYARTDKEELRWGFNFSRPFGPSRPAATAQAARSGPRPAPGRLQVSLYHTWKLEDRIEIHDGLPVIDRLDGGSGSAPQHEVQLQAGYVQNGLGAFVNGSWRSAYHLDGATAAKDLYFADQANFSLNVFADLSSRPDLMKDYPWLRGARVQLQAQNLFDARQAVHDGLGVTPQAYQKDFRDPLGRTVRLSFRKLIGPAPAQGASRS